MENVSITIILLMMIMFWLLYYFSLKFLISKQSLQALHHNYGLSFNCLSIQIESQSLTEWLNNLRLFKYNFQTKKLINNYTHSNYHWQSLIVNIYFKLGVIISYVLLPFILYQISKSLIYSIEFKSIFKYWISKSENIQNYDNHYDKNNDENQHLIVLIPGLTLSFIDSIYFLILICFCSFIHECGHAFAANKNSIKIETIGFQFNLCLPLTFVSMSKEQYNYKDLQTKMEIICTGLWNNFLLCFIAFLLIIFNPMKLLFYTKIHEGLLITSIDQRILTGLNEFDIITKINTIPIRSLKHYEEILTEIAQKQIGYCIERNFLEQYQSTPLLLCDQNNKLNECCNNFDDQKHLCFIHISGDNSNGDQNFKNCHNQSIVDSIKSSSNIDQNILMNKNSRKSCLPVRKIVENFKQFCHHNNECLTTYFGQNDCIFPLSIESRQIRLIIIENDNNDRILFWGTTNELLSALNVIDFKPTYSFISINFHKHFEKIFRFLWTISLIMLQFNMIPLSPLDGHQMLSLLLEYIEMKFGLEKFSLKFVANFLHYFSLLLIFCLLLLSISKFL